MALLIPTPPDFSFHETISAHGWLRLLPFVWHDHAPADWIDWRPPAPPAGGHPGVLERVEELPDGRVVLLRMTEAASPPPPIPDDAHRTQSAIAVDIPGDLDQGDESVVVERVRRMFQLDLDIAPFLEYCQTYPALQHVATRRQGRLLRSPSLFEDAVKVIATTNTTWSQTKGMVQRIVDSFGAPLPSDPTRRAFPTPQAIAAVTLDEFADRARLGYRNAAVHSLAVDIAVGRIDLETWPEDDWTAAVLEKRLLALRGIGPYAAACLMLYLGKPVKVNVDSWARMMVGKELGRKVTDKEVHAFFADYGDWRGLAYYFYGWKEEAADD